LGGGSEKQMLDFFLSNGEFGCERRIGMIGWSKIALLSAGAAVGLCVAAKCGMSAEARQREAPVQYCARIANDDTLRTPPDSMMAAVQHLFGVGRDYPRQATYYRCADGNVMLCIVGANLPCGKANTSAALPAAAEWCRANPNADFIPMAVTGHDSIYRWRCVGGVATAGGKASTIDARGFFAEYWKALN
jgi:hypothetical protein